MGGGAIKRSAEWGSPVLSKKSAPNTVLETLGLSTVSHSEPTPSRRAKLRLDGLPPEILANHIIPYLSPVELGRLSGSSEYVGNVVASALQLGGPKHLCLKDLSDIRDRSTALWETRQILEPLEGQISSVCLGARLAGFGARSGPRNPSKDFVSAGLKVMWEWSRPPVSLALPASFSCLSLLATLPGLRSLDLCDADDYFLAERSGEILVGALGSRALRGLASLRVGRMSMAIWNTLPPSLTDLVLYSGETGNDFEFGYDPKPNLRFLEMPNQTILHSHQFFLEQTPHLQELFLTGRSVVPLSKFVLNAGLKTLGLRTQPKGEEKRHGGRKAGGCLFGIKTWFQPPTNFSLLRSLHLGSTSLYTCCCQEYMVGLALRNFTGLEELHLFGSLHIAYVLEIADAASGMPRLASISLDWDAENQLRHPLQIHKDGDNGKEDSHTAALDLAVRQAPSLRRLNLAHVPSDATPSAILSALELVLEKGRSLIIAFPFPMRQLVEIGERTLGERFNVQHEENRYFGYSLSANCPIW